MDYSSVEKVASVYKWAMQKESMRTLLQQEGRIIANKVMGGAAKKAVPEAGTAATRLLGKTVKGTPSTLESSGMVSSGNLINRLGPPSKVVKPGVG